MQIILTKCEINDWMKLQWSWNTYIFSLHKFQFRFFLRFTLLSIWFRNAIGFHCCFVTRRYEIVHQNVLLLFFSLEFMNLYGVSTEFCRHWSHMKHYTPIGGPNFIIAHKQYSHVVATHTVKTPSPKPREQLICVRMTQCFNSAYYNIIIFFRLQSTHFLYLNFSENHSPLRFFIRGKVNLIDCNKWAIIHFICLWVVHTVLWD